MSTTTISTILPECPCGLTREEVKDLSKFNLETLKCTAEYEDEDETTRVCGKRLAKHPTQQQRESQHREFERQRELEHQQQLQQLKQTESLKIRRRILLFESLLPKLHIDILPDTGYVDEILINYSLQHNLILTQDQELKRKLQKPYLTIRQKNRIILVS